MAEKIFVDGFMSQEVADTAPEWILGKASIKIEALMEFLENNKKYAVNGFLNIQILRSKTTGKRYTELDLYQWSKLQEKEQVATEIIDVPNTKTSPSEDYPEGLDTEQIPF